MKTIVLCGKREDTALTAVLIGMLRRYGRVQYYNGEELGRVAGDGKELFCVYDSVTVPAVHVPETILVFKNSFGASAAPSCLSHGIPAVFSSHSGQAAEQLKGAPVIPVACGTSPRDTLSVASLTEGDATVSLLRSLCALNGELLEPKDVPVRLSRSIGTYPLLAACAVCLLCGIDSEQGYEI
jgi:hypothetical protein